MNVSRVKYSKLATFIGNTAHVVKLKSTPRKTNYFDMSKTQLDK